MLKRTFIEPRKRASSNASVETKLYRRFYDVIRRIPRGSVVTYGQVARLAGMPAYARHVGYALAALVDQQVPWHRVINSKGEISARPHPTAELEQRALLEKEKIIFDSRSRISLKRFQWKSSDQ